MSTIATRDGMEIFCELRNIRLSRMFAGRWSANAEVSTNAAYGLTMETLPRSQPSQSRAVKAAALADRLRGELEFVAARRQ